MKRNAIFATLVLVLACAVAQAAPPRWWPAWEITNSAKSEPAVQAIQYLLRARPENRR